MHYFPLLVQFSEEARRQGKHPADAMRACLANLARILEHWSCDDATADECLLLRTAALHVNSAVHSLDMLAPAPPQAPSLASVALDGEANPPVPVRNGADRPGGAREAPATTLSTHPDLATPEASGQ